jgi:hypothetical protein
MSRTDVHRPWHVQLADPYNRHILYRYPAWPWGTELTSYRNIGCGCGLCTGQPGRKLARKQERVTWRRVRQQALNLADRSDVDVSRLRGSAC